MFLVISLNSYFGHFPPLARKFEPNLVWPGPRNKIIIAIKQKRDSFIQNGTPSAINHSQQLERPQQASLLSAGWRVRWGGRYANPVKVMPREQTAVISQSQCVVHIVFVHASSPTTSSSSSSSSSSLSRAARLVHEQGFLVSCLVGMATVGRPAGNYEFGKKWNHVK